MLVELEPSRLRGAKALTGWQAYAPASSHELKVSLIGLRAPRSMSLMSGPGLVPPSAQTALSPAVILMDVDSIGLVPDGITRVKWVFDGWGQKPSGPRAVYPKIHGNVAVAKAIPGGYPLRSATWYDAGGTVIGSYSDAYWIDREKHFNAVTQAALDSSYRQQIAPSLREHFAVARLPRLKGFVAGGIDRNLAAKLVERNPYGLNVADSHFVYYPGALGTAPGTKSGAMVIPGSHGACLSGSNNLDAATLPGFTCVGLARVSSGSFHATTATANGSRTVVGLVPDGNASVTALLGTGHERTASVSDNVWALTLPAAPVTLLVKNAAGRLVRVGL
jgi:hypothetical protein